MAIIGSEPNLLRSVFKLFKIGRLDNLDLSKSIFTPEVKGLCWAVDELPDSIVSWAPKGGRLSSFLLFI